MASWAKSNGKRHWTAVVLLLEAQHSWWVPPGVIRGYLGSCSQASLKQDVDLLCLGLGELDASAARGAHDHPRLAE